MSTTFTDFTARFHEHFTADPNACVNLGVDKHMGALPDPSDEAAEGAVESARALLAELPDVLASLDADDFGARLDLELARLELERDVHNQTFTFNGYTQRQQLPCAGEDISDGIFQIFLADPRPAEIRLGWITSRIEGIPEYLDALLASLTTPLARWVKMDLEQAGGLGDMFAILENWAVEVDWDGLDRFRAARAGAEVALTAYLEALQRMETTTALHIGVEQTRELVALRGIDLDLEALHGIARDFLASTNQALADLRDKLVVKYDLDPSTSVEALHTFLNDHFGVKGIGADNLTDVLDIYEAERQKILAFIEARDLFPILEGQDMKILRTPAFMAPTIPAGAMVPPAAFREGVRTSIVYLTLSPELLDEHTHLGIPTMMIHEGIPGHHLQFATASMHSSVIRRHVDANDLAEGWTTMLEDYMLDMGYMGDLTDEARFIGKRDICRIGARVAIDLFFMSGERRFLDVGVDCDIEDEDPFKAAGNLLQKVTGFTAGRVQAELNWYSTNRGYPLSYLTGNHLVWQLKRDVTATNAGTLEGLDLDRAFHKTYLEAGNMPVRFLRQVFAHKGLLKNSD